MAARLKGKGSRALIARELALLYSESSYEPSWLMHLPGVLNVAADALSRISDPTKRYDIPKILHSARRDEAPLRDQTFYTTLMASQSRRAKRKRP